VIMTGRRSPTTPISTSTAVLRAQDVNSIAPIVCALHLCNYLKFHSPL
jgi:hypothetical protein